MVSIKFLCVLSVLCLTSFKVGHSASEDQSNEKVLISSNNKISDLNKNNRQLGLGLHSNQINLNPHMSYFQTLENSFKIAENARKYQSSLADDTLRSQTGSRNTLDNFWTFLNTLSPWQLRQSLQDIEESSNGEYFSQNGAAESRPESTFNAIKSLWNVGANPYENFTASPICKNQTEAFLQALESPNRPLWAIQLFDAIAKPPAGITQGNVKWLGSYKTCKEVNAVTDLPQRGEFKGTYCTTTVYLNQTLLEGLKQIEIGVCIPDSCTSVDLDIFLNKNLINLGRGERTFTFCVVEDNELDLLAFIAIGVIGFLALLMIIGTIVDIILVQWPKWQDEKLRETDISLARNNNIKTLLKGTRDITTNANSLDSTMEVGGDENMPLLGKKSARTMNFSFSDQEEDSKPGICSRLIMAFSVYTNGTKLLAMDHSPGSLTCVYGIRFLSMTWVVLGHAFFFLINYVDNPLIFTKSMLVDWTFQAIANATVSVDSFFVLSGLLVSYLALKEMKKKEGKLNFFMFYFHRFWRLTPPYMLVIMVSTCLSPYMGSGPMWPGKEMPDRKTCPDSWWTNLLYVNNLVKSENECLGQSWYLANDMQFYILSPLIFVPYYFYPVFGSVVAAMFLIATTVTPAIIEYQRQFSPGSFAAIEGQPAIQEGDFMKDFYIVPWTRMGAYVIGLMAGAFLYSKQCKLNINKWVNIYLWLAAAGIAMGVLYGLYDACNGNPVTRVEATIYAALFRQAWSLSVAWVIIACVTGNGGFVNTLLSWRALIPLSRLTYTIYLLHIMIMIIIIFNQETLYHASYMTISLFFLGTLVISYLAAFVTSLAFEAPMMGLEKVIFHRDQTQSRKEK